VNGLTAYPLRNTNTDTTNNVGLAADGNLAVTWGHRVWKRSSAGVETEITSGTPVAQCSKAVGDTSLTEMTATWDILWAISIAATDAIVDRLYIKFGTGSWQLLMESITEQLGGKSLDPATWTFKCWYQREYISGTMTRGRMYFASNTYNSRILNFKWTPVPVVKKQIMKMDLGPHPRSRLLFTRTMMLKGVGAPPPSPTLWDSWDYLWVAVL
jgi:hypothetical protein